MFHAAKYASTHLQHFGMPPDSPAIKKNYIQRNILALYCTGLLTAAQLVRGDTEY